jgi:hypothetical protein
VGRLNATAFASVERHDALSLHDFGIGGTRFLVPEPSGRVELTITLIRTIRTKALVDTY